MIKSSHHVAPGGRGWALGEPLRATNARGELYRVGDLGVRLVCVWCETGAMELRRRKRDGETASGREASANDGSVDDHSTSEAAADAVVGAAVRGGSLLMLLALVQVGVGMLCVI